MRDNPAKTLTRLVVSLALIAVAIVLFAWFILGYSYDIVQVSTGTMEGASSTFILFSS